MRSIRDKRRDLWENNAWVLHHDNAPGHSALSIRQFLAENDVPTLEQPPYSPDLAPCDVSYSPSSRGWSRGPDFPMWSPSKGPWRRSSGGFQKKSSGGASKRGRRGWTSVWDWRETILKGTSCDFNIFFGIKISVKSVLLLFRWTYLISAHHNLYISAKFQNVNLSFDFSTQQ